MLKRTLSAIFCLLAVFPALAAPTTSGPVDQRNLTSSTVTGNGVTNSLGTWLSYLSGATNPNPILFNGSFSNGGSTAVIGSYTSFYNPTTFGNASTGVVAKFNRIQVGVEALQGTQVPQSPTSWVNTLLPNTTNIASISATNQIGQLAIVGAARTSDYRTAFGGVSGGSEGIVGIGVNDDTTASTNPIACGVCSEAVQMAGVGGSSVNQFDVENFGSVVDVFPAGVYGGGGSTAAALLTAGAVNTGLSNATAGLVIGAGLTATFRKGILILNSSLDTSVGNTGKGIGLEMGDLVGIRWMNSSNTMDGEIWGFPGTPGGVAVNGVLDPISGVAGVVNGSNAAVGLIGELITATSTNVSLTSGTAANAASESLTPGDWDVQCSADFVPAASTLTTVLLTAINTVSATMPSPPQGTTGSFDAPAQAGIGNIVNSPIVRENLTATTTVYCPVLADFSTSTLTVSGVIRARRMR
jgi:hypothetical protein